MAEQLSQEEILLFRTTTALISYLDRNMNPARKTSQRIKPNSSAKRWHKSDTISHEKISHFANALIRDNETLTIVPVGNAPANLQLLVLTSEEQNCSLKLQSLQPVLPISVSEDTSLKNTLVSILSSRTKMPFHEHVQYMTSLIKTVWRADLSDASRARLGKASCLSKLPTGNLCHYNRIFAAEKILRAFSRGQLSHGRNFWGVLMTPQQAFPSNLHELHLHSAPSCPTTRQHDLMKMLVKLGLLKNEEVKELFYTLEGYFRVLKML
jgi:hypothetical protein